MLKELYERQSIRHFTNQKVEEEKIEKLLRAAMNAPTARNRQDWRFLVIRNKARAAALYRNDERSSLCNSCNE